MKIIFIFLMCLSFFGCSKNQKTDEIVQNTESEVIEIEEEIRVDEEIKTGGHRPSKKYKYKGK